MTETSIKTVFNDMDFDIDTPAFLKEVIECSGQTMYKRGWDIFLRYIKEVVTRATELNDPVLNAIMLRMNLYECNTEERKILIKKCKNIYYEEINNNQKH